MNLMMENNGMRDIVERLNENIISDAFERRAIIDGALCERLIRERKEAAEEITRLRAEHKMAFEAVGDVVKANDELRSQIESAEQAYVRLDASMNRLKAAFRVNMLRAFPHMSHDEIDAEIEATIRESGDE